MKYTRRKFITTLGAGSALLMLPSVSSFSKPVFSGDKKLGIALVGLGNYATHQLAPALQETSLCYLNRIVTGTPAKISSIEPPSRCTQPNPDITMSVCPAG